MSRLSPADEVLIAAAPGGAPVKLNDFERLAVGFVAGTLARTATSPLDVVKMLLQVQSGSTTAVLQKLWAEDGIAGFWRGNVAACVRLGPQSAIKFYAQDELMKRAPKQLSAIQRTAIGATAGIISQALTYPLDVVRTRITVDPKKYSTVFGTIQTICAEEGFGSLYAGLGTTIIGVIPYEGPQFYAQGTLKNFYLTKVAPGQPVTPWANCMIGACAGLFSQVFSYPLDVVRKKSMLRGPDGKPLCNGLMDGCSKIWAKEGVPGFYRGFLINQVKVVPFAALQFTLKEEVTKLWLKYKAGK